MHSISKWVSLILLFSLPWAIYQALQVRIGSASVEQWLPETSAERRAYDRFVSRFGSDQRLMISWAGCDREDARLEQFVAILRQRFEVGDKSPLQYLTSTTEMLEALTRAPLNLSETAAIARLQSIAIGPSGTCCVLTAFSKEGCQDREKVLGEILAAADQVAGLGADALILGGELYQSLAVDQASEQALRRFVIPSMLAALAIAWYCLQDLRLTIIVFLLAGLGQLASIALIHVTGGQLSAVLIVLPTMVFMLMLSGAVHLMNYYLDAGGNVNASASFVAMRQGAPPCILATLTTVIGFMSLAISNLRPVREFGVYSGASLAIATLILICTFPQFIRLLCRPPQDGAGTDARSSSFGHRWARRSTQVLGKYSDFLALMAIVLIVCAATVLPSLRSSTEFLQMFSESNRAVRHIQWLEANVLPIHAIEILVEFDLEKTSDPLERAKITEEFQSGVESLPQVVSVLSPLTFLPELPSGRGTRETIARTLVRRALATHREDFIRQRVIAVSDDGRGEIWRITARVSSLAKESFAQQLAAVRDKVNERSAAIIQEKPRSYSTSVTGLTSVMENGNQLLLNDLSSSFLTAFLLITPVMMLIMRSAATGLLLMIPNVLPVALVFGGMAYLGIKLDIASVLTASVAIGIAVDDTLHFMNWVRKARKNDAPMHEAIRQAMDRCAPAMVETTLICCAAMLPFFFSSFLPTSKFAALMILILLGAIVGDLIFLPALLLSRIGRFVTRLGK